MGRGNGKESMYEVVLGVSRGRNDGGRQTFGVIVSANSPQLAAKRIKREGRILSVRKKQPDDIFAMDDDALKRMLLPDREMFIPGPPI